MENMPEASFFQKKQQSGHGSIVGSALFYDSILSQHKTLKDSINQNPSYGQSEA